MDQPRQGSWGSAGWSLGASQESSEGAAGLFAGGAESAVSAQPFYPSGRIGAGGGETGLAAHASAKPFIPPGKDQRQQGMPSSSPSPKASAPPFMPGYHPKPVPVQHPSQMEAGYPQAWEALFEPGEGEDEAVNGQAPFGSLFAKHAIRQHLAYSSIAERATAEPAYGAFNGMPSFVHKYHTLLPLEPMQNRTSQSDVLGIRTLCLKGVSSTDGKAYTIRWVDPQQVGPSEAIIQMAKDACRQWRSIGVSHPHIAAFRGAFVSSDMEDTPSLYFVHDYCPGSQTVRDLFLTPRRGRPAPPVSEPLLWSFACQFATLLRAVHSSDLACRAVALAPSKVLVREGYRLALSSVGLVNVLARSSGNQSVSLLQAEDLVSVGHLLLCIACHSESNASLHACQTHFSAELTQLIAALMRSGRDSGGVRSSQQLCTLLADQGFRHLELTNRSCDVLMTELKKELQNGRMLRRVAINGARLLMKLSFVRSRFEQDERWSETGDRYILKLFLDFVFRQFNDDGSMTVDWGLAFEALNKLDAGSPEQISLVSRDEQSLLVVSYRDVRQVAQNAYQELVSHSSSPL